jgi:hypothetical protein
MMLSIVKYGLVAALTATHLYIQRATINTIRKNCNTYLLGRAALQQIADPTDANQIKKTRRKAWFS